MNRNSIFFSIISITLLLLSGCRSFNYRVAENYYNQFAYAKAIPKYEKVLSKDFIPDAAFRLADSYNKIGNTLKAEIWYKRLVNYPEVKIEYKLQLAEILMENGKYAEAKIWFQEYLLLNSTDKRVKRMIQACDSIHLFFEDTTMFNISLLKMNGESESNFSPAFYKQGIVFLSDRSAPGKYREPSPWTGKEYLDLFYTYNLDADNWKEPELLRGDINGRFDEGPASFTKDNSTIYFTRTDYLGKVVEKNLKDISLLKMYYGKYSGDEWHMIAPMPFNSTEYSVGHPSLSPDGNTLYFVSDMPWGYGGTDIYMSKFKNGSWSDPVNLGVNVNSEGNEMFPFIANDSVLYYSSDGLIGLGGLDIYASIWDGTRWLKPENLQYPVNSSKDDFGFVIDSSNTKGYYSSNRIKNTDKLFGFRKNPPVLSLLLYANDKKNSKPLKSFSLTATQKSGQLQPLATGQNGVLDMPLNLNIDYKMVIKAPGYYASQLDLSTFGKRKSQVFIDSLSLDKIELNKSVIWQTINFVKKETKISASTAHALDSLFTILQMNPELQIEIISHTDSKGLASENLNISRTRADEIVFYLIDKGINAPRLISTGYGESKLLNYCRDGVLCLEEDHQVNNRVEIKVVELLKK